MPALRPAKVPEVCQVVPFMEYSYEPEPPVGLDTTIDPLLLPKHAETFVVARVADNCASCVMVKEVDAVALQLLVTVTLYVPAAKPVMSCVDAV